MTSFKVKYRPSATAHDSGTIYYQITQGRKVRRLNTSYHIRPDQWDQHRGTIVPSKEGHQTDRLIVIRDNIRRDLQRLARIERRLCDRLMDYSPDDLILEFSRYATEFTLANFMRRLIDKFKDNGQLRTAETYAAALRSFMNFRRNNDIMLDCITSEIIEAYGFWHKQRGNTPNTISFYARILRATYNRAVDMEAIDDVSPFKHIYTGVDKTVKRAISLTQLKNIRKLQLSGTHRLDYARDMFMMSFMLRGMSFIDMTYLRKSDLRNGHLTYRRRKTGQLLTIAWTAEMQAIIDKYPDNKTQYLLPIIHSDSINERWAYRNAAYNINRNLKQIAAMADIHIPLTMYVARHTWASIAHAQGIPLRIISEGMGHDSESTTQIYLSSLDTSVVDAANSQIISAL